MEYWNRIPKPGTTISGFADNKKKQNNNPDRQTLDFFDIVTVNTHIFFFGLTCECLQSHLIRFFKMNSDG